MQGVSWKEMVYGKGENGAKKEESPPTSGLEDGGREA